jgi:hypothetical protein
MCYENRTSLKAIDSVQIQSDDSGAPRKDKAARYVERGAAVNHVSDSEH